ncbi:MULTISPECIES: YihY/virulence factor BrkB family protein [unclassified Methanosarcina]|uniref:YihY/virulence factor BrkB family protein n=1 Tax=unclassified Methanosarcina TaxID=2644672 RepID=UPI0006154D92|nr:MULTISPECIES: YihY/virulence factor BrkB family protein [unclassified Methanosarcina]AKB18508.1 Inner membrane protein YihY, formerly thought to be RNase BN [Methanosarcina sp. WWM596]AKB21925.1 Inner membrane protein YihY, formerly thought to be RNase BN [Methanosarcina sp. WH1]
MNFGYIGKLITGTIKEWMENNARTYSAALAFYFVLSLPALLLFSVFVGSIFFRSKQIQDSIINNLQGLVDQEVIDMISSLFEYIPDINSLSIGAFVGFVILLWSASNVFRQLRNFLERAWDIKPEKSNTVKDFIKNAIVSFFVVIVFGGLFVLSIIVEGVLYATSKLFQDIFPCPPILAHYAGSIASFLILVLFFMLVYWVLPDTKLDLKPVFVGSLVTTILITIGKYALGIYFTYINLTSVYGAIGSIVGLFLLIYYISIMITIGAEFTKVYSESF